MTATKESIVKAFNLNAEDDLNFGDTLCFICRKKYPCENSGIDHLEKCAQFNPAMSPEEWFISLKRVIYEKDTKYADDDGGGSASVEIFWELNEYSDVRFSYMDSYLNGMTPEDAYEQYLKENEEDSL